MLQFDLTETPLFHAMTRQSLPNDQELFVITVALLLVRGAAYSEFYDRALRISPSDIENIALAIETRLPEFTRDVGSGNHLRRRINDFVGLQIEGIGPIRHGDFAP